MEEEPVNEVSDDSGEVPAVSAEPRLDNKNKKRKVEQVSRDVEEIVGVLKSSIQSREDRVNALENDCGATTVSPCAKGYKIGASSRSAT